MTATLAVSNPAVVTEYAVAHRSPVDPERWVLPLHADQWTESRAKAARWLAACDGMPLRRGVGRAPRPEDSRLARRTVTTLVEFL